MRSQPGTFIIFMLLLLNSLTNYIKDEGLVTGLLDFDSLHSLSLSSELQRAVDICHLSPATRSQKLLQVKPRRFLQGGISAFQNQHVFLVLYLSKSFIFPTCAQGLIKCTINLNSMLHSFYEVLKSKTPSSI